MNSGLRLQTLHPEPLTQTPKPKTLKCMLRPRFVMTFGRTRAKFMEASSDILGSKTLKFELVDVEGFGEPPKIGDPKI